MSLAFLCSSPAEVEPLYQQVIQAGYQGYKEPWDAFWGQRYAIIQDPDGNLIDLFANQVSRKEPPIPGPCEVEQSQLRRAACPFH
jgi:uncharacterized glyoxalase superfamily protein PhnB